MSLLDLLQQPVDSLKSKVFEVHKENREGHGEADGDQDLETYQYVQVRINIIDDKVQGLHGQRMNSSGLRKVIQIVDVSGKMLCDEAKAKQ